jgi:hypothetical protein
MKIKYAAKSLLCLSLFISCISSVTRAEVLVKKEPFFGAAVSLQAGPSLYLKQNERYAAMGLSFEERVPQLEAGFVNHFILGAEVNYHSSKRNVNLYDGYFLFGPQIKAKYLELDLLGMAGGIVSQHGGRNYDFGVKLRVGARFGALNPTVFISETRNFNKFGIGFGFLFSL